MVLCKTTTNSMKKGNIHKHKYYKNNYVIPKPPCTKVVIIHTFSLTRIHTSEKTANKRNSLPNRSLTRKFFKKFNSLSYCPPGTVNAP